MKRNQLFILAGSVWGFVGFFLILRGAGLYQLAVNQQQASQQGLVTSIALALVLGVAKGRFVLSRTARRNITRIETLSDPLKWHHVYDKKFYFLIAGMMMLGIFLRSLNEYLGGFIVVGGIYCGIGLALMVSSLTYWKSQSRQATESGS